MPSGIVGGSEMGVWEGFQRGPVLQLIKGEILQVAAWLPVSGVTWPEARDPHRRGETIIIPGWSLVQYVDCFFFLFWICMSNAIINVLREDEEEEERERLLYWF